MDRDDPNHPSRQGCPSRGGIGRKPTTKSRILTYRKRIQGHCSVGHPPRDGEAQLPFRTLWGNSDGPREEGEPYLRRSPLWSAHTGLPQHQCGGTGAEESAEAIVALPSEGRIVNARSRGRISMDAEQQKDDRRHGGGGSGGTRSMDRATVCGILSPTSLDGQFDGAGMRSEAFFARIGGFAPIREIALSRSCSGASR
jgi:hypothetical protein